MTYSQLLAFGCSHVAGCELIPMPPQWFADYDSVCKPLSFSNQVADRLSIPCVNWAMSGGSNARTLRLLARELEGQSPSIVIIGWTYTDRSECYWPDPGQWPSRDQDLYLQLGSQWLDMPDCDTAANRAYIQHIWRPNPTLATLHRCAQALCQQGGHQLIELIMTDEPDLHTPWAMRIEGRPNYPQWLRDRGFACGPWGHGLEDAHEALADLLVKAVKLE